MSAVTKTFAGTLLAAALVAWPAAAADGPPQAGTVAPLFELPSLSGGKVSLADFRGKIVVLHFGAGW